MKQSPIKDIPTLTRLRATPVEQLTEDERTAMARLNEQAVAMSEDMQLFLRQWKRGWERAHSTSGVPYEAVELLVMLNEVVRHIYIPCNELELADRDSIRALIGGLMDVTGDVSKLANQMAVTLIMTQLAHTVRNPDQSNPGPFHKQLHELFVSVAQERGQVAPAQFMYHNPGVPHEPKN